MPPNPLWDRKPSNSRPAVDNNELSAASAPDHTAWSHASKMLGINGSSLRDRCRVPHLQLLKEEVRLYQTL
jgi:hypothetical protein